MEVRSTRMVKGCDGLGQSSFTLLIKNSYQNREGSPSDFCHGCVTVVTSIVDSLTGAQSE